MESQSSVKYQQQQYQQQQQQLDKPVKICLGLRQILILFALPLSLTWCDIQTFFFCFLVVIVCLDFVAVIVIVVGAVVVFAACQQSIKCPSHINQTAGGIDSINQIV